MLRSIAVQALICLLAACGGGSSPTGASNCTIEINADSILSGTGIPMTGAQAIALRRPHWTVDDRAIAGLTLDSLVKGYSVLWPGGPAGKNGPQPAFADAVHASHIVIIELGGNDALDGADPVVFKEQLRGAVSHIRSIGHVPVLTGIVPVAPGPIFTQAAVDRSAVLNAIAHQLASDMGVIDAHIDTVPYNPSTDSIDGIHRTAPAFDLIADRLVQTLAPLLINCTGK